MKTSTNFMIAWKRNKRIRVVSFLHLWRSHRGSWAHFQMIGSGRFVDNTKQIHIYIKSDSDGIF